MTNPSEGFDEETPVADAIEQRRSVDDETEIEPTPTDPDTIDANPADRAEQQREVPLDDSDDYPAEP